MGPLRHYGSPMLLAGLLPNSFLRLQLQRPDPQMHSLSKNHRHPQLNVKDQIKTQHQSYSVLFYQIISLLIIP